MAHSFAKRFNKEKVFTIDCTDFEYRSLEELYVDDETVYQVRGLYINKKSMYTDKSPLLATDKFYVNLPDHLLDDIEEILNDRAAIADINRGVVGFRIYKYFQKKYNKECYSITWVDIDPSDFTAMNEPELGEE